MTTTTATLTEFVLARVAEDEAAARATLLSHDPLDWSDAPSHLMAGGAVGLDGPVDGPSGYSSVVIDPARVLAECEAKRVIVRRARRERGRYEQTGGNLGNPIESVVAWETAVRALAAVHADHPDYDKAWRP